jgi:hypothetical protein
MPAPHGPVGISKAWQLSHGFTDAHGHSIPGGIPSACFNGRTSLSNSCLVNHHMFQSFVYEPASRFWPLQGAEAGIFMALSVALLGLSLWWISRRIA